MRLLVPVLGRLQSELLQPLIIRVFSIMLRNNLFTQPPEILQGQEVDVEYVSPMALAQKGQELSSIMRGMEIFGSISQMTQLYLLKTIFAKSKEEINKFSKTSNERLLE